MFREMIEMMFSKSLILKKLFFIFLNHFDMLILKIILEKFKKYYFNAISKNNSL
jgi:hypothetical protein